MGIQDRDWHREHHRSLRQAARPVQGTVPTPRAITVLAMLVVVLAAGCALVAAAMAVRFMVDTGASVTSIPQALARRVGITACVPRPFSTAAGVANGCIGRATTLAVAGLQLANAQVAVMPLMQDTALLGMDVLSRLHTEQRGRVMRLAPAGER